MMEKINYTWIDIEGAVLELSRQINNSQWKPDYIVGLARGGLTPATMLSHYLDVPMHPLRVSLRDGDDPESNLWMAEDAFELYNILIVDDINDSGATINWIKQDWQSGCSPNDDKNWSNVWHNHVRFAVLTNNLASKADIDYNVWEVNKAEKDCWLVYPWEEFWMNWSHR